MACGGLGVMGCLSFHPRKVVTTGEGGAVTTSDDDLDASVRRLRHHGIATEGEFAIRQPSTNYRLSDLHSAIGITQLARLDELLAGRRRVAEAYTERLGDVVATPAADEGDEHGWQAYVVQLDRRDEALAALRGDGIEARSAPTRCTALAPTTTRVPSATRTPASPGRSPCPCTPG
ncbi:MAG: hypothetical protein E6G60_09455 [Actinobacteria bacterium]|nr:MAG: hypothetical protein E6G60_09455 [Actinomycetota bacterium]